jgi:hypothetical protein
MAGYGIRVSRFYETTTEHTASEFADCTSPPQSQLSRYGIVVHNSGTWQRVKALRWEKTRIGQLYAQSGTYKSLGTTAKFVTTAFSFSPEIPAQ